MADAMSGIVRLDELDEFEIAEGDPDVRDWDVISSDGRRIGKVDELLIDTGAMKARYLGVDLDEDLIDTDGERHVLVPIGYARLDENDDQVFVDALASTDVAALPGYTHEPVTRESEVTIVRHFDPGYSPLAGQDFYAHDLYDESRFYGPRRGS
jgi:photosynthetic reaction center H subunit